MIRARHVANHRLVIRLPLPTQQQKHYHHHHHYHRRHRRLVKRSSFIFRVTSSSRRHRRRRRRAPRSVKVAVLKFAAAAEFKTESLSAMAAAARYGLMGHEGLDAIRDD